jgi:hypothetical protein
MTKIVDFFWNIFRGKNVVINDDFLEDFYLSEEHNKIILKHNWNIMTYDDYVTNIKTFKCFNCGAHLARMIFLEECVLTCDEQIIKNLLE